MSAFNVGDRVKAVEQQWDPVDEVQVPLEVVGVVSGSRPADELYRKRPTYKKYTPGQRKETKFPVGSTVYQVAVEERRRVQHGDQEPYFKTVTLVRNFHEGQLERADG